MQAVRSAWDNRSMGPRLLIVDDHPSFRREARAMFEKAGFQVVGEAVDGASAISASADLLPEIVILDIRLPDIDGFEVTERLADVPGSPIVVLVQPRMRRIMDDGLLQHPRPAS